MPKISGSAAAVSTGVSVLEIVARVTPRLDRGEDTMGQAEGKVAIVTGGASGLAAACATTLVREGAKVVITDIDGAGAPNAILSRRQFPILSGSGRASISTNSDSSPISWRRRHSRKRSVNLPTKTSSYTRTTLVPRSANLTKGLAGLH